MSRTTLITTDAIFVIVLVMAYQNGDIKKYPVILGPVIIAAFATCVVRHFNYYHLNKKIY